MKALGLSLSFLFLCGCAALFPPPHPPLTESQVRTLLEEMEAEDRRVSTFYSVGRLLVGKWYGEAETDILVVGARDPFRLRIEIRHTWGRPILHVLVRGQRLEVLSFSEQRIYEGAFTPEALSRFFPCEFPADLAWAVLRGFPKVVPHEEFCSPAAHRIRLLGPGGREVEVIEMDPETFRPSRVLFPGLEIRMDFSRFRETAGIAYAEEVAVRRVGEGQKAVVKTRRMVFNRRLPAEIFLLDRPPGFTVCDLPPGP